ncbi:HAMP domain-containing sensor histidine kinase [Labedaea rhizosphaerae]|uniref:histidine kinase n=1 Tax=Labedaea rhizosphaerae TaxID=598644 RepID=A0A4R6SM08_LABRH|nr:HAMP domain-containing sensor histidine kinase [Labedaea rhizosphaerae]TDQ04352.1 two-component system sensor histidine kinase MprB [Labedaea rhizosphaerae]
MLAGAGAGSGGRQRISLRSRVTLLAAMCVAGAVALVSLGAYITVSNSLYAQLDQSLEDRAQAVVTDPTVSETNGTTIPGYIFEIADVKFDLIDVNGNTAIDKNRGPRPPVSQAEIAVARGERSSNIRTDGATDSRVLAWPYPFHDGIALVIARPLGPTRSTLSKLAVVLFVIGGAGVVVAALAGTAVAQAGLRPVQRLSSATERVARTGDLRPIPVTGDDELAQLTTRFNSMLGAVADSQERQRRLVADAGHELRTPLTSLRTNLELLLAAQQPNTPKLSEQDQAEISADLHAQLDELTQLIGDLVDLARVDAAQPSAERVDLVEVVEQALDRARRRAGTVRFDVQLSPWVLYGDDGALERAVLNLLDNAVKFSPPDGTVHVRLADAGDGFALLQVIDEGPGIKDVDLPHVFDRFYRSQESRTMPGSGLGLAIVQQAAQRHGGQAYAARGPQGGAMMTLRLPGRAVDPQ